MTELITTYKKYFLFSWNLLLVIIGAGSLSILHYLLVSKVTARMHEVINARPSALIQL